MMAVKLGGFYSGYYVGILLMMAGGYSVLPMRITEVLLAGGVNYIVYMSLIAIGTLDFSAQHMQYSVNNTFFFFSIIGTIAVQSTDELKIFFREQFARTNIARMRHKLHSYTHDLETLVQRRLDEVHESSLKFQDLYNTILDLILLIDTNGVIVKVNERSFLILGKEHGELVGKNIDQVLVAQCESDKNWFAVLSEELQKKMLIQGYQLRISVGDDDYADLEVSAGMVEIEGEPVFYQLIVRDITSMKEMENELLESERLIGTSRQATIFGLAKLAECRDDDTGAHLKRIQSYTHLLCKELSQRKDMEHVITNEFIQNLRNSSVLHDIGKVGIPDSILLKTATLTEEEFELMKNHSIYGANILSSAGGDENVVSFLKVGSEIARSHHERWDGKGYPEGLSGNQIPLSARIIALADVYDALTSSRVYKPAFSHEVSREIILKESGGQFDPKVVYAFMKRERDFKETRMRLVLQQNFDQDTLA